MTAVLYYATIRCCWQSWCHPLELLFAILVAFHLLLLVVFKTIKFLLQPAVVFKLCSFLLPVRVLKLSDRVFKILLIRERYLYSRQTAATCAQLLELRRCDLAVPIGVLLFARYLSLSVST